MFVVNGVRASSAGITPDLNSCVEKLRRADEHYRVFNYELWDFLNGNTYGAVGEVKRETGEYVFKAEIRREPPARLGALLGEVIHQLRSTLDHLIWQLASWHLEVPAPNDTTFPNCTKSARFDRTWERLRGRVPDDWHAVLKELKPYDRDHDPLAVLDRLWNCDKHQALVVVPKTQTLKIGPFECRADADAGAVTERRPRAYVPLVPDAEFARIKIDGTGPHPRVDMYDLLGLEVFLEGSGGCFAPMSTLETAAGLVTTLVHAFVRDVPDLMRTMGAFMAPITTLASEEAARAAGFEVFDRFPVWLPPEERIPGGHWARP